MKTLDFVFDGHTDIFNFFTQEDQTITNIVCYPTMTGDGSDIDDNMDHIKCILSSGPTTAFVFYKSAVKNLNLIEPLDEETLISIMRTFYEFERELRQELWVFKNNDFCPR